MPATGAPVQVQTTNNSDARTRAINALMGSQPQQQVVQNQNQVQPEEMKAIQPKSESSAPETEMKQSDSSEENQEVTDTTQKAEPTKEEQALSRQFAQLARQEKALRAKAQQQEQAIKAREQALAQREADLNSKSQIDTTKYISRDSFKNDPLAVLAETGISYEELTQQILSQQPVDPRLQNTINQLKQEIQSLKSESENTKKSYAEQQDQAYQAAVKQIEMDVKSMVSADPITFEAINKTGTHGEVVKLITETYKKDGILLTNEEAAQQVEDYLVEENYKMATKIDKIKNKIQASRPNVSEKSAQALAEQAVQKQQQPMKTLTNATGSTRKLSGRERAILAFKGETKT